MGLGWLCCFVEKSDRIGWLDCVLAGWIVSAISAGSYRCITVSLDISGSGLYRLDWMDWIGWI